MHTSEYINGYEKYSMRIRLIMKKPYIHYISKLEKFIEDKWEMEYKHSQYNIIVESKGIMYVYNPFKGIVKLNGELYEAYMHPNNAKKEHLRLLVESKLLVEKNLDEYERVKLIRDIARFNPNQLTLSLAPTFTCNFDCGYCFVNKKSVSMNEEIEAEIVKLVRNRLNEGVKKLRITWLGGEPLIVMEIIKRLSHRLIELCNKSNCEYSAFIITNGSLLNKNYVNDFKELKINGIQITLDGPEMVHNKSRPMKKGNSFKTIIDCLTELDDLKFNLRINLSRNNIEHMDELLDLLVRNNIKDKISDVYISPVYATVYMNENEKEKCLTIKEFSRVEIEIIKKLFAKGIPKKFDLVRTNVGNSREVLWDFNIDPLGKVYKDQHYLGNPNYCIGEIRDLTLKNITSNPKIIKELADKRIEDLECRLCRILPICMGGDIQHFSEVDRTRCCSSKYNIEDKLKLYIDRIKRTDE